MTTETVETLVIGGGVSGLTYAHARGPRADLLVCEASSRSGGLVWTDADSLQGARFERGPEALQTGSAATAELLSELALELLAAEQLRVGGDSLLEGGGAPLEL